MMINRLPTGGFDEEKVMNDLIEKFGVEENIKDEKEPAEEKGTSGTAKKGSRKRTKKVEGDDEDVGSDDDEEKPKKVRIVDHPRGIRRELV